MTEEQTAVRSALPTTSNREDWTEEEAAAIEAAGLVFTYPDYHERRGEKVLAPRAIVAKFLHTCERTGLDPLARQIYCIPRLGRGGIEWGIQTAIDGFRVVAERSRKYAGQDAAEWLCADGSWVDGWVRELHGERNEQGQLIPGTHPLAARVRVYRHDWNPDKPAVGFASWDEYVQLKTNGDVTAMWASRGVGQLAKCAEALALRKGFPQDLSGIYTDDEMGSAAARDAMEALTGEQPSKQQPRSRVPRALTAQEPSTAEDGAVATESEETALDQATELPVDDSTASVTGLFECVQCGRSEAPEEGMICESCEIELEAARESELQHREKQSEPIVLEEPPARAPRSRGQR